MNNEDFIDYYPGKLVKIPEGIFAFIPNPLPPKIDFTTQSLVSLISDANLALGELKGIGRNLPNPYLLIGPLSFREAIVSSKLEGTIATAKEVVLFNAQPKVVGKEDVREVRNYVLAMNSGLDKLKDIPVSKRLFKELHKELLQGVRGQESSPGSFRQHQNHIGAKGESPKFARYVPPPANEMENCLNDLEKYINSNLNFPKLIELAIIHYQFEAIHPFMDGNGRIGRLLIIMLLCHWELLPQPLLYMSGYFERNKESYKDLLLKISQKSAWIEWIEFFLVGVIEQSRDAIMRSEDLLNLQSNYRQRIQSPRSTILTLKLADYLFKTPYLTTKIAAEFLEVTNKTAQSHIEKLVDLKILYEATGETRGRVYLAHDILEIIEKDYFIQR